MLTTDDLKRIILDALAAGDTFDAFRTALRQRIKEAGAEDAEFVRRTNELRADMRRIPSRAMADAILQKASRE